jgi:hypothetical protein
MACHENSASNIKRSANLIASHNSFTQAPNFNPSLTLTVQSSNRVCVCGVSNMSFKMATVETFSFDGESFGASGAAALRKVRSLAESAPAGRLFASIATLTEMSAAATVAAEAGQFEKATHIAAKLAKAGELKLPSFFRRKA